MELVYRNQMFKYRSYAAAPTAYIDVLHDVSDEYVRVLMVGHNPGLEQLVNMLSGKEHTCLLVHLSMCNYGLIVGLK